MKDVNNLIDHLKRIEVYRIPGSDGPMVASVSEETLVRTIAGIEHLAAERDALRERANATEQRFWSIVDQNGLTGLPSDMWDALDRLVKRDAATAAENARLTALVHQLGENAVKAAREYAEGVDSARNKALEEAAGAADALGGDRVERGTDGMPCAHDKHDKGSQTLNAMRVRASTIASAIRALKDTRHD